MPIVSPVSIEAVGTEAFGALDYKVMKEFYAAQKELGRAADESVYQADITERLRASGYQAYREVPITVSFESFAKRYSLDLVVEGQAVYELKTATRLCPEHEAQLMNYLLMLDLRHGKLINLRPSRIEGRYINAPMRSEQRKSFEIIEHEWKGDLRIRDIIIAMLRDWGTGLELPLYQQATIHLLGGEELVTRLLPMHREAISLGNQRFHLMDDCSAFRFTAFARPSRDHARHLMRLIHFSPLHRLHWINVSHAEVTFSSLSKD